jgi:hypothetical protein
MCSLLFTPLSPTSQDKGEGNGAIDRIDDIRAFAIQGTPTALILKLRSELGSTKRISNRVEVIKEVSFLPAGYAIAEFATASALLVLLLLRIEPFYEGVVLIGVIALIVTRVISTVRMNLAGSALSCNAGCRRSSLSGAQGP